MNVPVDYRLSLAAVVDEILWRDWDPIQINAHDGAHFEYSNYVSSVTQLLREAHTSAEVAGLLEQLSTERMGTKPERLPPGHHTKVAEILVSAAKRLMQGKRPWEMPELRRQVAWANQMLPETGLVTMHSGNASGYDPDTGNLVIKPSGMDYESITPSNLVEVRLSDGKILSEGFKPSVDLSHHLYLYRHLEGVRSVIHTHSNYATAFAAVGKAIPLVLTAIADEFGAEVPCAPYIDNEGEHIGEAILKYRNRSPAILMGNHGVFAWGDSPKSALKAAVMVEDVAKTVWLSMQLGTPHEIPAEEAEKWYDRYHNRYGQ